MVTDAQVRKLMEEMAKHGRIGDAALKSGMDRKTARRYVKTETLPSVMAKERTYRTRKNPFEQDWREIEAMLDESPTLEAKTIFESLMAKKPGRYQEGQLRTLQRHVRQWRAASGPPKEVFFAQDHRPGEAMQTDFTSATKLGITIGGEPYDHLLCHSMLPFSNWESATACTSESMSAIKRGVQTALFRLGCVPSIHQTDHSTAATHRRLKSSPERCFNEEYVRFCDHFAMTPRTTTVGAKEQNGDVEVSNRQLKRRLEQRLLIRGSRDFASSEVYEAWLWQECSKANRARSKRVTEEIAAMRPLPTSRLPEYSAIEASVTSGSTVRVKNNTYSVPARLIGEKVQVRVYDARIEVYYRGALQLATGRLRGEAKHRVNYRHVIESLVRKPGAFERYRYREDLFPSLVFRRAYDRLKEKLSDRDSDLHYLRILREAAQNSEVAVSEALLAIAADDRTPTIEEVTKLTGRDKPEIPEMAAIVVDLTQFDALLDGGEEMAG